MSEMWNKFKEQQPITGQWIFIADGHNDSKRTRIPYAFRFIYYNDKKQIAILGHDDSGDVKSYMTKNIFWRDMIKLPGEK